MYDSIIVANRFLSLAQERGDSLTPMQVLKLTFIAHGWMLGAYGRTLISDDVQAWQYGPVIPRLYNAMRKFGGSAVQGPLACSKNEQLSEEAESIIRQTYDIYGSLSGIALSRLTHEPGTPWAQTYVDGEFGVVIPVDLIENHYRILLKEGRAA